MAAHTILCPSCEINTIQVAQWAFSETSVVVSVCDDCGGYGLRLKLSALIGLEVPTYSVRHRDGLVIFA